VVALSIDVVAIKLYAMTRLVAKELFIMYRMESVVGHKHMLGILTTFYVATELYTQK
jgi:hypothetical protein